MTIAVAVVDVVTANLVVAKANRVKITQRQLRRIIRESLEEKYGKDYLSKTHSDGGGEEKPSVFLTSFGLICFVVARVFFSERREFLHRG